MNKPSVLIDQVMPLYNRFPARARDALSLAFDGLLLNFPFLYCTSPIAYESHFHDAVDHLHALLNQTRQVRGDIIECGASRCGTSCIIGLYLKANHINKKIFSMDSFGGGFDRDELEKEKRTGLTTAAADYFTHNSITYVTRKIRRLGLEDFVFPVKGWFRETLPTVKGAFSLAIIDCDLEDSTTECLDYVWPRVSSGGVMVVDDYESHRFQGVKRAVDAFLTRKKPTPISHVHKGKRFEIWK